MSSITGLRELKGTSLINTGQYRTGNQLDPGTAGEVLISGGPNLECTWGANGVAVPNPLSAGATINYTSGNPSWDGGVADTINVTKVPNALSEGTTINFSSGNPSWDGSAIDSINVVKVPNSLIQGKGVEIVSNGFFDGSSGEVIDVIPPNVYFESGEYRLCWTGGDWRPNDDHSYYNIGIEDSSYSYVRGSAQILSTYLELCALIKIPAGWIATKYYVFCRYSSGAKYTGQQTYVYKVYNDGDNTTNSSLLGSAITGCETEITMGTPYAGEYASSLLVRCLATSTSYYFGGGYIVIEKI